MQETTRTLWTHHLFKSLDDAGKERLLSEGSVKSLEANETLTRQGETGSEMFLILRGTVRVEAETDQGRIILAELGPGACVGEVSTLTSSPRTATVTAVTEVDVAAFAREAVADVLNAYPKVRKLLASIIEGRARDMMEKQIKG